MGRHHCENGDRPFEPDPAVKWIFGGGAHRSFYAFLPNVADFQSLVMGRQAAAGTNPALMIDRDGAPHGFARPPISFRMLGAPGARRFISFGGAANMLQNLVAAFPIAGIFMYAIVAITS